MPMYYITYEQMNLINEFRFLWSELTIWAGMYIISRQCECPNVYFIYEKLHNSTLLFYNTLSTFYGPVVAENFTVLINRYIVLIRELIEDMINGDQEGTNQNATQLYELIDEISTFLSRLNPYWSKEQWTYLLREYTDMLFQLITADLSGDYQKAISIFDRLITHTILLGDYMARGIIQYLAVLTSVPESAE